MKERDSEFELSIVLPCLNEVRTLPKCLLKARGFLDRHQVRGEIVVADNGSADGSAQLAEAMGAHVVRVEELGYGAALAGGIAAARGKYVIMGDADDSYDMSDLMPMLGMLRSGYAMVIGNRFKGSIMPGAMPWLNRYLGNPVLSALGKLFFHIPVGDFHCGVRGFEREAFNKLDLRTTGMEFASEMIVRAAMHNLRIGEVPVTLHPDGRGRRSHLHPWRDGWRHLRFLLLYSPRWLYLYPGIGMLALGLIIAALLLPGPMMIAEGVGLDVHTLLVGAMSILVGVQSITFGFIARSFAMRNGIIPRSSRYDKWLNTLTLEKLLIGAGVMIALGLSAVGLAMERWTSVSFGALDYRDAMRILIVAITLIVGGIQLGFAAFLLGIMQIKHK